MLQPMGCYITAFLGDRPAVFAFQIRQQSQHQPRGGMTNGFVSGERGSDAIDQRAEIIEPAISANTPTPSYNCSTTPTRSDRAG